MRLSGCKTYVISKKSRIWSLRLQEYDFEMFYKPEKTHILADGPLPLSTKGLDKSRFDDEIPCLPRYSPARFKANRNLKIQLVRTQPKTLVDTVLLTKRDHMRSLWYNRFIRACYTEQLEIGSGRVGQF